MARIDCIPFTFPGLENISCVFTTRTGGVCKPPFNRGNLSFDVGDTPYDVRANRTSLAASMGVAHWHECVQVHGDVLHFESESQTPEQQSSLEGDGFTSSERGHALVIKTADCQPILIAHNKGDFVAALHNGWRGNSINYPGKSVTQICEHYGCSPSELMAVRGPSLSPALSEFVNFNSDFEPGYDKYFNKENNTVDLWKLTHDQLAGAGINPQNIFGIDMCTYCMSETFFSYRRDRNTGRQLSVIWIK
ncbi:polyphenol oxidase family protein [Maridesulfovibrio ferrireducens]|uniref:polyphenol oxidase family protein n=1 Tax=Maridesulfovibrio ferrireducens TaxID=246191 RepID=UPI001A329ACF|nr:polyphenol oxidase family protein [Maridesulfovibrio ferrireducens]MBI9111092.1 laccase domain-containing protein [Maridesulfovibrio ferrireducens]